MKERISFSPETGCNSKRTKYHLTTDFIINAIIYACLPIHSKGLV